MLLLVTRLGRRYNKAFLIAIITFGTTAAFADDQTQLNLRWITLGTAGGPVPIADRGQPANALAVGSAIYLIDCGDGAADALAKIGITLPKLKAVVLSHLHVDHTGGLAALIGLRYQNNLPGKLKIYGPPGTQTLVDGIVLSLRPYSDSAKDLPGADTASDVASTLEVHEVGDKAEFILDSINVQARANTHYSFAPNSEQAKKHVSLSYRFTSADRTIVFTGDTGPSSAVEELAHGADLLVTEMVDVDRTVEQLKRTRPDTPASVLSGMQKMLRLHHLTPEDVGQLAKRSAVKSLVITHLVAPRTTAAERMKYLNAINSVYSGPVMIANDLDEF